MSLLLGRLAEQTVGTRPLVVVGVSGAGKSAHSSPSPATAAGRSAVTSNVYIEDNRPSSRAQQCSWRTDDLTQLVSADGAGQSIYDVDTSPDGRFLATSGDSDTVDIRDATTLQVVRTVVTRTPGVRTIAFSPDQRLLATISERDPAVRLWDATTGALAARLNGHISAPNSIAFHPSTPLLAAGSPDASVLLWQLDPGTRGATDLPYLPVTAASASCPPAGFVRWLRRARLLV